LNVAISRGKLHTFTTHPRALYLLLMNKVITSVAEMYIDEDGILRIKILTGTKLTIVAMKEYLEASYKLLNGKKALVLFDGTAEYEVTEEAKAFGASKEVQDTRIAIAFVTKSITNSLMFNLYLKVYKPEVPTKMFSSNESGLKWLRSFYVMPGDKFERKKKN